MDGKGSENGNRPGQGAEAKSEDGSGSAPFYSTPQDVSSTRPVVIKCDVCGITFEKPIAEVLNQFTTRCPECAWCVTLPRDCWPSESLTPGNSWNRALDILPTSGGGR